MPVFVVDAAAAAVQAFVQVYIYYELIFSSLIEITTKGKGFDQSLEKLGEDNVLVVNPSPPKAQETELSL